MKASTEYRAWVNWMRSKWGKKNGVIKGWFFDCPSMELKAANNKRLNSRHKRKAETISTEKV